MLKKCLTYKRITDIMMPVALKKEVNRFFTLAHNKQNVHTVLIKIFRAKNLLKKYKKLENN